MSALRSWLIALIALVGCMLLIIRSSYFSTSSTTTASPSSLRGSSTASKITLSSSTVYTLKASSYDQFRFTSPGQDVLQPVLTALAPGLAILDLGCGSGAFLNELAALEPRVLDAIDPNQAMVDKSLARVETSPILSVAVLNKYDKTTAPDANSENNRMVLNVHQGDITNLPSSFYDVVFCAQILQNLTPDPAQAAAARQLFLTQIRRVLKPGGKLVLTTRAVSPGVNGRWSDLYWYADPLIAPRAVAAMEAMVPVRPLEELVHAGFEHATQLLSRDLVVRPDAYSNSTNLKNSAYRSADSFFQHVHTDELGAMLRNIESRHREGTLKEYMHNRDALRGEMGHVAVLVASRPNSRPNS